MEIKVTEQAITAILDSLRLMEIRLRKCEITDDETANYVASIISDIEKQSNKKQRETLQD